MGNLLPTKVKGGRKEGGGGEERRESTDNTAIRRTTRLNTPYYTAQPAVLHGHALPALRAGRGGPGGGRLGAARACPPGRGSWGRFPPSGVWGGAPASDFRGKTIENFNFFPKFSIAFFIENPLIFYLEFLFF